MKKDLEERLAELDRAREKIIHDSFIEEQKEIEKELRKAKEELERGAKEASELKAKEKADEDR